MKKSLFVFFIFLSLLVSASHNRSGEITYKRVAPFTEIVGGTSVEIYWYLITITKYTDDDTPMLGSGQQNFVYDRCIDSVRFGDGDVGAAPRINGGLSVCANCQACSCSPFNGNSVPCGSLIIDQPGYRVKKNIYQFRHLYPGAGSYLIRTIDPNRNSDVVNIPFSNQQPFYLESLLIINSITGSNSSPQFMVEPIYKACVNKCFSHSAGAYDNEGDSLSYKISTSRGANGQTVPGYWLPSNVSIDKHSGILTWCSPNVIGEFNIAFIVEEWRKNTSGKPQLIGYILRDIQILVNVCPNSNPPGVITPKDTCVEAGSLISKKIIVSDPDLGDTIRLRGYAGAFSVTDPKGILTNTINSISASNNKNFAADFNWQTSCNHIRQQYYQTTFMAEDNGSPVHLVSFNVYNIRVVPPAVKNVLATPLGSSMKISWTLSTCSPSNNPLIVYKVYRKDGCNSYTPDYCQTGVPATSGFIYIGQCNSATAFLIDGNNGDGLVVGQYYTYLVVAVYKDGAESYSSNPVCGKLKRDIPIVLNVDVLSTSITTGSITIRWSRPLKTQGNFDTLAFPGPYQFNLKHKSGGVYTTIYNTTRTYLYQLDTVYTHVLINTVSNNHEYSIEFISGTFTIGSSQKASSVFLKASPSDRKIDLQWESKTPWKNYSYTVYRKNPSSQVFTAIATTTATNYSDVTQVVNRNAYCYYILSQGEYSDPTILKPLLNKSQEVCTTAIDLTSPCTPTLEVDASCPNGLVEVSWKNVRPLCSDDVINYILYYKNTSAENYQKIYEGDTTYFVNDGLSQIAGCYAIKSVDSSGNTSALSPDFCIDNCPEFELPNIFSPNKDGANDFFKAIKVRQVKEIDLKIVDRWGNLMYTTHDPYFQWDGNNMQTDQAVSEGTFFYVCTVFEPRIKGIIKRSIHGYIQVVR